MFGGMSINYTAGRKIYISYAEIDEASVLAQFGGTMSSVNVTARYQHAEGALVLGGATGKPHTCTVKYIIVRGTIPT